MRTWTHICWIGLLIGAAAALASAQGKAMATDLDVLTKLNDDYIQSVQHSNVKRFEEILADDFLCSNPDGTLIDRKAFLQQTAKPVTIRNLAGARRQRAADGRLRHHPRENQLHDGRRRRKRRPLYGRLGAPQRQVAGRVSACDSQVDPRIYTDYTDYTEEPQ